jgi:hypothetical protein
MAEIEDYVPYILPVVNDNILHLQDLHIPYHCSKTISLALEYAQNKKVNTLVIGFDFIDNYIWVVNICFLI